MSIAFTTEILLPSGAARRINELNNKDYLAIIKFCQNNDFYGLSEAFESLYEYRDLDIIDKFYILIYVRMLYIDSNLTFNRDDGRSYEVGLDRILSKLKNISSIDFNEQIKEDGVVVSLSLPKTIFFKDVTDLYNSIITSVEYNGDKFYFKDLDLKDKDAILNKLPSKLFDGIQRYIDNISSSVFNMTVIEGNEKYNIDQLKLNLISNGVIEFIAAIFKVDLFSYYELLYAFYNTILHGSTIFEDLSPVETKLILKIHNKNISKQNEELKKQNK